MEKREFWLLAGGLTAGAVILNAAIYALFGLDGFVMPPALREWLENRG